MRRCGDCPYAERKRGKRIRRHVERCVSDKIRRFLNLRTASSTPPRLAKLYELAMAATVRAMDCQRAAILLFDAAGVMRFVASRGLSETYCRAVEGHSPGKLTAKMPSRFASPILLALTCQMRSKRRCLKSTSVLSPLFRSSKAADLSASSWHTTTSGTFSSTVRSLRGLPLPGNFLLLWNEDAPWRRRSGSPRSYRGRLRCEPRAPKTRGSGQKGPAPGRATVAHVAVTAVAPGFADAKPLCFSQPPVRTSSIVGG